MGFKKGNPGGPGRPKGHREPHTLLKQQIRDEIVATVHREIRPILHAQVSLAKGISYLVVRDRQTGKFIRVAEQQARLKQGEEHFEVWSVQPSSHAAKELLEQSIGKLPEDVNLTHSAPRLEELIAASFEKMTGQK